MNYLIVWSRKKYVTTIWSCRSWMGERCPGCTRWRKVWPARTASHRTVSTCSRWAKIRWAISMRVWTRYRRRARQSPTTRMLTWETVGIILMVRATGIVSIYGTAMGRSMTRCRIIASLASNDIAPSSSKFDLKIIWQVHMCFMTWKDWKKQLSP